jgi:hypothetical protein
MLLAACPDGIRAFHLSTPDVNKTFATILAHLATRFHNSNGEADGSIFDDMLLQCDDNCHIEDHIQLWQVNQNSLSARNRAPFASPEHQIAFFKRSLNPSDAVCVDAQMDIAHPVTYTRTFEQYLAILRLHFDRIRTQRFGITATAALTNGHYPSGAQPIDGHAAAAAARINTHNDYCHGCNSSHDPVSCPHVALAITYLPALQRKLFATPRPDRDTVLNVKLGDVVAPLSAGFVPRLLSINNWQSTGRGGAGYGQQGARGGGRGSGAGRGGARGGRNTPNVAAPTTVARDG